MTREDWNPRPRARPHGGLVFAGVLLLLSGAWQVFVGYSVAAGDAFIFSGGGYPYRSDDAAWGWLNLVIGLAAIALAVLLVGLKGRDHHLRFKVSLVVGVAAVSAINQFFLAPQFPLWSTLVIAADVFVIWAVTTQIASEPGADDDRIARLAPHAAPRLARYVLCEFTAPQVSP